MAFAHYDTVARLYRIVAAGSDARTPCPPVVSYSAADQARAADEVEALPEDAVTVRLFYDCAVLRNQAQICR